MHELFPETAARLVEWQSQPEVLGVLLVGSKSQGHADALSDDDLEVLMTAASFAALAPADCLELFFRGEGADRILIYDAQYTTLDDLEAKARSPLDLSHWPYERARLLFDRDGRVGAAVAAAAHMDPDFRRARLRHATSDASIAIGRARKATRRGAEGSVRLLVARGARALVRLLFALEWRWVPLDHWLEADLRTLTDPTMAGPRVVEALLSGQPDPLALALAGLEDTLFAEGVPRPAGRRDLFMQFIHPTGAAERAVHGLQ